MSIRTNKIRVKLGHVQNSTHKKITQPNNYQNTKDLEDDIITMYLLTWIHYIVLIVIHRHYHYAAQLSSIHSWAEATSRLSLINF